MKKINIGPCPLPDGPPESLASFADRVTWLRHGFKEVITEDGDGYEKVEYVKLAAHEVEQRLWDEVRRFFLARAGETPARAECFRSPYPYLFDRATNKVIRLEGKDPGPEFMHLLRLIRLLDTQKATKLIASNLRQIAEVSPKRKLYHLSYMSDDAVYLNAGGTTMIKITADSISEVPLGTDGVILIADDIGAWPPLSELKPLIEEMQPKVGTACTKLLPDLPMTQLLTTRWSHDDILSHDQNHQMFLTRFLFIPAASKYPLWPLTLLKGEAGGTKSSGPEMILTFLRGEASLAQALPMKEDALIASITNRSYVVYDNIDSFGLDDPKLASYSDRLCHIATGAEIDLRRLFTTNMKDTFVIHNHGVFTSRVNPFSRSDVHRRTLTLDVAPAAPKKIPKQKLFNAVLKARPALLAEYILRSQNILRAHLQHGAKVYPYQSEMVEYEAFTLVVSEYEGTLDSTVNLWAAYMKKYGETITSSNPLVHTVRCWLGKSKANANRAVSSTTLFGELRNVSEELGQPFTYKAVSAFGTALSKQISSLKVIGYSREHDRTGTTYKFAPSDTEMIDCQALYREMAATQKARPIKWDHLVPSSEPAAKRTPPSDEEVFADPMWEAEAKRLGITNDDTERLN
jgi:hypothetical protein